MTKQPQKHDSCNYSIVIQCPLVINRRFILRFILGFMRQVTFSPEKELKDKLPKSLIWGVCGGIRAVYYS